VRLRRLTRSPIVFWLTAIALALTTGLVVSRIVGRAQSAVARFGSLRTVAVALRPVPAGVVLVDADVGLRRVPAAFLPDGAVGSRPVGRTVVVPLVRGQAVSRAQLAPDGVHGVTALLPPGRVAIAVPNDDVTPPVRRGDVIDLLATFNAKDDTTTTPTVTVASAGDVLEVDAKSVTVAVRPDEAPRVAFAVAAGTLAVIVNPSTP
jgi:Flp pilus assembly protein CpaB